MEPRIGVLGAASLLMGLAGAGAGASMSGYVNPALGTVLMIVGFGGTALALMTAFWPWVSRHRRAVFGIVAVVVVAGGGWRFRDAVGFGVTWWLNRFPHAGVYVAAALLTLGAVAILVWRRLAPPKSHSPEPIKAETTFGSADSPRPETTDTGSPADAPALPSPVPAPAPSGHAAVDISSSGPGAVMAQALLQRLAVRAIARVVKDLTPKKQQSIIKKYLDERRRFDETMEILAELGIDPESEDYQDVLGIIIEAQILRMSDIGNG